MNTYNAQNPSEMLHLLFDGELDSSMETPLYASLVQNEDLRSELRELIAIRDSIRRDVEAYTPPFAATQGIFSKLGYTPPIIPKAVNNAPFGFWGLMRQKLWNPAVTAFLASIITALLFLNFYQGNENDNTQLASSGIDKINKSSVIPSGASSTETTVGNINQPVSEPTNVIVKERIKYVYITKNESSPAAEQNQESVVIENEKTQSDESIGEDSKSWLSMLSPVSFLLLKMEI